MSEEIEYLDEPTRERMRQAVATAEKRIIDKEAQIRFIKKRIPLSSNFGVRRNEAWRVQQLRAEIEALQAEATATRETLRTAPSAPPSAPAKKTPSSAPETAAKTAQPAAPAPVRSAPPTAAPAGFAHAFKATGSLNWPPVADHRQVVAPAAIVLLAGAALLLLLWLRRR